MFKRADTKETNIATFSRNESMSLSFISRSEFKSTHVTEHFPSDDSRLTCICPSNFQQFLYSFAQLLHFNRTLSSTSRNSSRPQLESCANGCPSTKFYLSCKFTAITLRLFVELANELIEASIIQKYSQIEVAGYAKPQREKIHENFYQNIYERS